MTRQPYIPISFYFDVEDALKNAYSGPWGGKE